MNYQKKTVRFADVDKGGQLATIVEFVSEPVKLQTEKKIPAWKLEIEKLKKKINLP